MKMYHQLTIRHHLQLGFVFGKLYNIAIMQIHVMWILRKATKIYGTSSLIASCSPCLCHFCGYLATCHGCQNDPQRKRCRQKWFLISVISFIQMACGFNEAWIALFWRGSQALKAHGRTQQGYCTLNHIDTCIIVYQDHRKTKLCLFPVATLRKS